MDSFLKDQLEELCEEKNLPRVKVKWGCQLVFLFKN